MPDDESRVTRRLPDLENWIEDYESRSLMGRFSLLVESGVQLATTAIDAVVDQTSAVVARTKKSLLQGLDPNVDDAEILEELTHPLSAERHPESAPEE